MVYKLIQSNIFPSSEFIISLILERFLALKNNIVLVYIKSKNSAVEACVYYVNIKITQDIHTFIFICNFCH